MYDDNGRPTGSLTERGQPFPAGFRHLAAELWLADAEGRLLLQLRSAQKAVLPGIWAMTTGCMTAGENSLTGILREVREELGLTLLPEQLRRLRRIVRPGEGIIWDVYAARLIQSTPALRLQAEEVDAVCWVTPDELRTLIAQSAVFVYPEIGEVLDSVERWLLHPQF